MENSNILEDIPIINISALVQNPNNITGNSADTDKLKVAREINRACRTYGFFYIVGHGINRKLEENLEHLSRQFFALPLEVKNEISMKNGSRAWRGYFPLGGELTSGRPDMKEGIYFGAELEDDHHLVQAKTPLHGKNIFLQNNSAIPGFKETVLEYISEMTRLGHLIMEGIALSLNLDEKYFTEFFTDDPLPLFRIFNYPAREVLRGEEDWGWGVGEHTDYGMLTILKQDNLGGLEVKVTSQGEGKWIQAPPIPGSFVCNIGDMLDRLTKGFYRSTPHRVRSPANNVDRLSFPFFFDPNFNSEVKAIDHISHWEISDDQQERWDKESVHQFNGTYGDYLLNKVSKVFPELRREVL